MALGAVPAAEPGGAVAQAEQPREGRRAGLCDGPRGSIAQVPVDGAVPVVGPAEPWPQVRSRASRTRRQPSRPTVAASRRRRRGPTPGRPRCSRRADGRGRTRRPRPPARRRASGEVVGRAGGSGPGPASATIVADTRPGAVGAAQGGRPRTARVVTRRGGRPGARPGAHGRPPACGVRFRKRGRFVHPSVNAFCAEEGTAGRLAERGDRGGRPRPAGAARRQRRHGALPGHPARRGQLRAGPRADCCATRAGRARAHRHARQARGVLLRLRRHRVPGGGRRVRRLPARQRGGPRSCRPGRPVGVDVRGPAAGAARGRQAHRRVPRRATPPGAPTTA